MKKLNKTKQKFVKNFEKLSKIFINCSQSEKEASKNIVCLLDLMEDTMRINKISPKKFAKENKQFLNTLFSKNADNLFKKYPLEFMKNTH